MERSRGFRLRRLRQAAGFRQQDLALAPPHPPPLEPQHPDRAGRRRTDAEAAERVYLVHQGRQGQPLTPDPGEGDASASAQRPDRRNLHRAVSKKQPGGGPGCPLTRNVNRALPPGRTTRWLKGQATTPAPGVRGLAWYQRAPDTWSTRARG